MYNFEKGNNTLLADDISLTIDNATIEQMVNTLNQFSEYRYKYKGNNTKIYDWNIIYTPNKYTLNQLNNELEFIVTEGEEKVVFYIISKEK